MNGYRFADLLSPCPCGSQKTYSACCGVYHDQQPAPTAEALMRSRFCAYLLKKPEYLLATTWPRQRQHVERAGIHSEADTVRWTRLEIIRTEAGGLDDRRGVVEFKAWFQDGDAESAHHEISDFVRDDGHWYFVYPGIPAQLPGRNDPCFCGSGRKYKKCCAAISPNSGAER